MAAVAFDTLQFVKKLQTKGFKVEQAEGISEALQEVMAVAEVSTKNDLRELRSSVKDDIRDSEIRISNNPPAKPGAFICEPLKAARRGR
ncbi:hypothetical protein AGMMS50256_38230 [Betaproteobacteria bacterium]|nr:hypothetical protein AGMMS50256_38230 [Betaproteobacteria bacterium]